MNFQQNHNRKLLTSVLVAEDKVGLEVLTARQKEKKLTREKSCGTIFFNNHVTFPSRNLEKQAIFQEISKNIHEHFIQEIKTVRLEKFGEKIEKKFQEFSLKIPC